MNNFQSGQRNKDMARINIDDEFWASIGEAADRIGDYYKAVGYGVYFVRFAQMKFSADEKITASDIEKFSFLEGILFKKDGDEVTLIGQASPELFDWVTKRKAAGRKGGLAKASKTDNSLAKPEKSKQKLASSSSSSSSSNTNSVKGEVSLSPDDESKNIVGIFCQVFMQRYGKRPVLRGIDYGMLKQLVNENGIGKASSLVTLYLKSNDPYFIREGHSVKILMASLMKVDAGKATEAPISAFKPYSANEPKHVKYPTVEKVLEEQQNFPQPVATAEERRRMAENLRIIGSSIKTIPPLKGE